MTASRAAPPDRGFNPSAARAPRPHMSNQDTLNALGVRAKLNSGQALAADEHAVAMADSVGSPVIARQCAGCDDEGVKRKAIAVSQPNDPEEMEADRMADAFVGGGNSIARSRAAGDEAEFQRKAKAGGAAPLPAALSSLATSAGHPLSSTARRPFENFFRTDLSDVRVHDNAAANRAAKQLNAHAFARGPDLFFAAGQLDTNSTQGQRLLAHELTHVTQPPREASGHANTIQRDPTDEEIDAGWLRRLELFPGLSGVDFAPQLGGLETWSERYPRSYDEMRARGIALYGQAGFDALLENDAEILVLVQESDRLISRLDDLRTLYETEQEAAHAVLDFYVGINYLYGAEDVRGLYDVSYSYFGEQFQQDAEFDLGLFHALLDRDLDDIVAEIEAEANAAQDDADADAAQRQEWADAGAEWLGIVVAARSDFLFDDDLALESVISPPEGSTDADEMLAVARFAGHMAAVIREGDRYYAFTLSEDFDRSDIFVSPDWDTTSLIRRAGPYAGNVHAIVASGGFVLTGGRSGEMMRGGDQAHHPEAYLEADTRLLESGRAAELGISPTAMFTSMVRNLALANLRQAELSMSNIESSMKTDHYIDMGSFGTGLIPGPDPAAGRALQTDSARLRELTLQAERLALEIEDEPLTDEQTDRRDTILNEMGQILQRNPAAGFFVQNHRDPDDEDDVEDDDVSDDLEGLRGGDAARRAIEEAEERRENIGIVRRAMFDNPDVVLGFEPLHAAVLSQFSSTDQLLIRGSMALKSIESAATTVGLLAVDLSLLIAGFFTGGSTWAGMTLHAAGTGLSMYQLNKQMEDYRLLSAMSATDVPGGENYATPGAVSSARNWLILGLALNFLGIVGMARSVSRLMVAAQREGTLVSRIARSAGVADEVMEAALRRNLLGVPRPDPAALRQIVLARLPEPLQRRFAGLVIDVLDEERWAAIYGRNSAQHAATSFARNSAGELYPTVINFRARGNVLALQEEAMHLMQATDPAMASRIGRLADLSVDAWSRMPRADKLRTMREVLELEHDVQSRLLQQAQRAGDVDAADDAFAEMSDLAARMDELDNAIGDPASALPGWFDSSRAPLHLFASPRLPRTGGSWSGIEGNSIWRSTHPDVIDVTGNGHVRFRNGYPDFSPYSVGRVNIGMSGHASDFAEADRLFAEGIARGSRSPPAGYTRADFMRNGDAIAAGTERYRRAEGLTWHHHQGGNQMLLVPTRLHANVPHTGGASAARASP